jgi:hypothetical protein
VLGPERRISPSSAKNCRVGFDEPGSGMNMYSTWMLCNKHLVVLVFVMVSQILDDLIPRNSSVIHGVYLCDDV